MCYDNAIRIAWILSIQLTAMSSTNTTTTLSPEALPIVWRTSTTTQLPVLPTYLVPPPITLHNLALTPIQRETTTPSNNKHPNHNYDNDYTNNDKQNTTQQQLFTDINNLDLNLSDHPLQNKSNPDKLANIAQRDRSRLKAYSDSFPVLGNVSLGSDLGNAGNDSRQRLRYEGTLMAFANNPFGNGKKVGKGGKKCYNSKKCNSTTTDNSSPHSNNFLLDTGQALSPPASKPGDSNDSFDSLNQPSDSDSSIEPRFKRGVIHLYNMVSCATGCNPLIYKGYGCYCGFLGSGYAVDGIDRCCKFHDWCYDTAKCPMYLEYFIPYYWKCYHRRPICAIEHGEWGGAGSCAQRLCECDRVLSECLSRYPCPSTRAICTSSPWRLLQNAFMIL